MECVKGLSVDYRPEAGLNACTEPFNRSYRTEVGSSTSSRAWQQQLSAVGAGRPSGIAPERHDILVPAVAVFTQPTQYVLGCTQMKGANPTQRPMTLRRNPRQVVCTTQSRKIRDDGGPEPKVREGENQPARQIRTAQASGTSPDHLTCGKPSGPGSSMRISMICTSVAWGHRTLLRTRTLSYRLGSCRAPCSALIARGRTPRPERHRLPCSQRPYASGDGDH
jgi:hypothetical protein